MRDQEAQRLDREHGFSMVEIVISMFLLGILSLAVLPLIFGLTQRSVENRGLLAATALANGELAKIAADFPSEPGFASHCSELAARASAPPAEDTVNGLQATLTVGACPADATAYPASVPVLVTVTEAGGTVTSVAGRARVGAP